MSTLPRQAESEIVSAVGPARKMWARDEYYRLGEQGWFQDQRVELVDGEIVVRSPQSPDHFLAIERIRRCLERTFGERYWVRLQGPVTLDEFNEPEPDVCVVKGIPEEFADHPTNGLVVVEVSRSSLNFDKTIKQSLYASKGVSDYWVLDLENRQILVHRQPAVDTSAQFGHRYQHIDVIIEDGHVAPLEKPDVNIAVADMLPPTK